MRFKDRLKILFFNFLWRFVVILFELYRMLFTFILFPLMLIRQKWFNKMYLFFHKDIKPKNNNS